MLMKLPLADITADPRCQMRARTNEEAIEEYAAIYLGEADPDEQLPPLKVVHDRAAGCYWLYDGFHRLAAAELAGLAEVDVEVCEGDFAFARHLARKANRGHGVRLTNDDKRRLVLTALEDHPQMSDRAIARECGVSPPFVGKVRSTENVFSGAIRVGSDGRAIDTSSIGRKAPEWTDAWRGHLEGVEDAVLQLVPLTEIRLSKDLYHREAMCEDAIERYALRYGHPEQRHRMPPVRALRVRNDPEHPWVYIWDGFMRVKAASKAGLSSIPAGVFTVDTWSDARMLSCAADRGHDEEFGRDPPLSMDDLRYNIRLLAKTEEPKAGPWWGPEALADWHQQEPFSEEEIAERLDLPLSFVRETLKAAP